ncbi:A-kinase anchor protein inhibitor 1 isoform X2 [Pogoniulus pusillus]|uniref:A-kinase anchor protein inhibitor 1 isoform X2 n=2 Tax=Pogoniulus pusillus TaxID=488313 RepID=UPI0030B922D6
MVFAPGEKPGLEQEEVRLQNASKQIVQTAILRALQQVSRESQQKGAHLHLERGKLTKKHEKKSLPASTLLRFCGSLLLWLCDSLVR